MKTSSFLWVRLMGMAAMLFLQLACTPQGLDAVSSSNSARPGGVADEALRMPKTYSLSIVGYNYTDRGIDSFEVDGRGGGNMGVSTPTSSGQGSACCYPFTDTTKLPMKVQVTWVGSYCRLSETNSAGETRTYTEPIWRVAEGEVAGPIPDTPKNLEVHLYRDGHVEVAVTDRNSPARLHLAASADLWTRPGLKIDDPVCPADYERARSRDRAISAFKAKARP